MRHCQLVFDANIHSKAVFANSTNNSYMYIVSQKLYTSALEGQNYAKQLTCISALLLDTYAKSRAVMTKAMLKTANMHKSAICTSNGKHLIN